MQPESQNSFTSNINKKIPKVSVCVVTYNQEKYIKQCLQSIVDQETDFDFEIIVGDDCSTDGTRKIIMEFVEKFPDKFKILFHPQNIGAAFNYARTHELAAGDYVAHMDGDDLMLPGKLQKQVDVFAENNDCVIVTHDMQILNKDNSINKRTFKKHKAGINTIWDLYRTLPFFAHSSKMVKRDVESKVLGLISKNTIDIELHVGMAEQGNIYHIDEPLGVYRVGVGISSNTKKSINPALPEATIRIYEGAIKKHPESAGDLKKYYARAILNYAYQSAIFKKKEDFNRYLRYSIGILHYSFLQTIFLKIPNVLIFAIIGLRNKFRHD